MIPVIDTILAADVTAPASPRHTAKRIFERLQAEHGYTGFIGIRTPTQPQARSLAAGKTPTAGRLLQGFAAKLVEVLVLRANFTESRAAEEVAKALNARKMRPQRGGKHRADKVTASSIKHWRSQYHEQLAELRNALVSKPIIPEYEVPALLSAAIDDYARSGFVNFLKM